MNVGLASTMSRATVVTDSAYAISAPQFHIRKWPASRSKAWDRGSHASTLSLSVIGRTMLEAIVFVNRLWWVSTTPFGSPVVPEV